MSRASLVYVAMLVALAGGLWAVLRAGAGLKARPDLSGRWELEPLDLFGPQTGASAERLGRTVEVEQSGQFFRFTFQRGRTLHLRLMDEQHYADGPRGGVALALAGGEWQVAVQGRPNANEVRMTLNGPLRRAYQARRVVRTYPAEAGGGPIVDVEAVPDPTAPDPPGQEAPADAGASPGGVQPMGPASPPTTAPTTAPSTRAAPTPQSQGADARR